MANSSQSGLPAPRQGRRGRNFGALLTTSDAVDSTEGVIRSTKKSSDTSRSEVSVNQGAGARSSKQPTPKLRQKDNPPHLVQPAPEKPLNSRRAELEDSAQLNPQSSPETNGQSQPIIQNSDPGTTPSDVEETCLICAESIKYFALGACSHRTCHICAIRMRALYRKRDCALCKTELKDVVITTDPQANFANYDLSDFKFKDPHLSIYCETFEQLDELLAYLKFNCPHPECSSVLQNWKDLKYHTRTVHNGLSLCDLCCSNKKVFAHEHTLFTTKGITVHMNQGSVGVGKGLRRSRLMGDDGPETTSGDDDGFKGHPRCGFCSVYYYDDDQLYQHCRDKHEQCFICVRNGVGRWQYYLDYKHLESHFRDDHYLCSQAACLQARFVVYETALELQTHQIETHGAEMGVKAIKDARKLETNFVVGVQEQHSQTQHTSRTATREQRAGRGIAVMDIAPIGGEGSITLSNANRIVPGLAPNRGRSDGNRPHKGKSKSTPAPEIKDSGHQSSSNIENVNQGGSNSSSQYDVQRHDVLMQRVSEAVKGAEAKTTSFKVAVRTYRNNEMGASDLIDTLCNIFDHRSETIGPILSNLLDLLDVSDERKGQLLEKWLDLKLQQTQYPSLDGNNTSKGLSVGNSSSRTVALSSLQTSSWVRQQPHFSKMIERSARTQNREVPGLVPKKLKSGAKTTPWASGSSSAPSARVNNTVQTRSNQPRPAASTKVASAVGTSVVQTSHFPSLPTKQVPIANPSRRPNGARQDAGTAQWVTATNELPAGPSTSQPSPAPPPPPRYLRGPRPRTHRRTIRAGSFGHRYSGSLPNHGSLASPPPAAPLCS